MKLTLTTILLIICTITRAQTGDSLLHVLKSTNINSLKTDDEHKEFLWNIYDVDQGIRKSVFNIETEYGFRSTEYDSIFNKWRDVDRYLFEITVEYLDLYPYPKNTLGGKACSTPILVFHHVAGTIEDLELKKKFFPNFYVQYKDGSIGQETMYFYLFRLYSQVFNEKYDSELPDLDQISEMIELLNLKTELE